MLLPDMLVYQDEYEGKTRQVMTKQAFAAGYREGSMPDFEAAVAYALGERFLNPRCSC